MPKILLSLVICLTLSAPVGVWAQSSSASPRLTPYEPQRDDVTSGAGPAEPDSPYRTEEFNSRLHGAPPPDSSAPLRTVPPRVLNRNSVQDRARTRTQWEAQQRAITERSRQPVAQPKLGIPGQQPLGIPNQPSRGVPGQQPRPAWQPKQ